MKIQIVLFDGFDELDVLGMYEPLRLADYDVKLVSFRRQDVITAAYGMKIVPDTILSLDNLPGLLCVPGGGWIRRAAHGAWAEAQKGDLPITLADFYNAGVVLAAVCTGSMLLAKAGLLNGRPSTTNQGVVEELKATGARVISARVVDDGDIITAGGVSSSLDLGLWLVERFSGIDTAIAVANSLEFERRGVVWQQPNNTVL